MLVAESGSTKTEWRYCQDGKVFAKFRSPGFNPNVMSAQKIREQLSEMKQQYLASQKVESIFFYGAGTRGEAQNRIVTSSLKDIFPDSKIFVGYDLLAAARSTQRKVGIACILGTGSNSCLHRNYQIEEIRGGLGYIFGDEGSGADLGKHLMKGLLQGDFPEIVKDFIEEKESKSLDELKMEIIIDPKPNVRMASLSKYLPELVHIEAIEEMITSRFVAFFETTVCRMANHQSLPIDIIGSIGFYFSKQLSIAASSRALSLKQFIKDPADNLVQFHLNTSL